jgi:hypothetical protein
MSPATEADAMLGTPVNVPAHETSMRVLAACLFVAGLAASGTVVGFCAGGFWGKHFGEHAAHGLADLVYLFEGALLGAAAGIGLAAWGLRRWPPARRWKALGIALAGGLLICGLTWTKVNCFGGW